MFGRRAEMLRPVFTDTPPKRQSFWYRKASDCRLD